MSSVTLTPDTITFPDTNPFRSALIQSILDRIDAQADALEEALDVFGEPIKPPALAPKEKKRGVWVDGKLKLQTRDPQAIEDFAQKMMRQRHSVWVAPIGSFVTS